MRAAVIIGLVFIGVSLAAHVTIVSFNLQFLPIAQVEEAPHFWAFALAFLLRLVEVVSAACAAILAMLGALYWLGVPLNRVS